MSSFINFFSNRELSIFFWIIVSIIIMMFVKNIRQAFWQLALVFFEKKILIPVIMLIGYSFLIVFVFWKFNIWDKSLIKDTGFWLLTVAFVYFFSLTEAKSTSFFIGIIKKSIKGAILLEFVMNFYCFSFFKELLIVPFMVFIGVMHSYANIEQKKDAKLRIVATFFKNLLTGSGLIFLSIVIYRTIAQYRLLFTVENLKSLMLPPIFTVLLIPFLYAFTIYREYELLFMWISRMRCDENFKRQLKKRILISVGLNLNRLTRVSRKLIRLEFSEYRTSERYIKAFLK